MPLAYRAYIHLDNETTTLDASTGHIRSIGWVVTDGNLNPLPFADTESSVAIHPSLWDMGTLDWARETYGLRYVVELTKNGQVHWPHALRKVLAPFFAAVQEIRHAGYEVWLIVNHPEFDVTLLREACKLAEVPYPVKYNHHLDWQSLYLATASAVQLGRLDGSGMTSALPVAESYEEILKWADPVGGKENVEHRALADARRQLQVLRNVGVRLPL